MTGLLNDLIRGYITPARKTGRGNIDVAQLERAKEILRMRHPHGVRAAEIARHVGCGTARVPGLLDMLSGNCDENANTQTDFLVYQDDSGGRPVFGIAKDIEMTGTAMRPAKGAYRGMWD